MRGGVIKQLINGGNFYAYRIDIEEFNRKKS